MECRPPVLAEADQDTLNRAGTVVASLTIDQAQRASFEIPG